MKLDIQRSHLNITAQINYSNPKEEKKIKNEIKKKYKKLQLLSYLRLSSTLNSLISFISLNSTLSLSICRAHKCWAGIVGDFLGSVQAQSGFIVATIVTLSQHWR